jgi:hypothetical protein
MPQQLRISSDFYETVKTEAEAMRRKPGSQLEHWARLGRLLEKSATHQQVQAFLNGNLPLDALNELEHAVAIEALTEEVASFSRDKRMKQHLAAQAAAGERPRRR